ncbi:MAG: nucleotidyl transferase AbiEii/AbiGii toxin family protein [Myxococcaceae bacterium]|nr:nucleotidyl transferase AbiEii/AbiGii toxin family protein [Myxococcaceae bacterium]
MPLTPLQSSVGRLLAAGRSADSYLAGGAALHRLPNSTRFSNDLDYFHDSVERVASAFAADSAALEREGYQVAIDMKQPGYIRARVVCGDDSTKIEWAHDSAWRFMPTVADAELGFVLHPVDLALNKVLALVGRNEPRDFLDVLEVHERTLCLGALCWASVGKDPGFTPRSLLELLRRRSKYQPEDFDRLRLTKPVELPVLKVTWSTALDDADALISALPAGEIGCLYYSTTEKTFVDPRGHGRKTLTCHYGRPGGVLPRIHAG